MKPRDYTTVRYAVLGFLIGFVAGGTVGLLAGELT